MQQLAHAWHSALNGVIWLSVVMHVIEFLAFGQSAGWRKITFAVLGTALLAVAITSGFQVA
jgi:hypothetical protein